MNSISFPVSQIIEMPQKTEPSAFMTEGVSGECLLAVTPDRSNEIVQGQILSFIDSVASPANAFIFTLHCSLRNTCCLV